MCADSPFRCNVLVWKGNLATGSGSATVTESEGTDAEIQRAECAPVAAGPSAMSGEQ
jgi:hypothetical protein